MCSREGCNKEAVGAVSFKIRCQKTGPAADAMSTLFVCQEHVATLKVDDIITDEAWNTICNEFVAGGYVRPRRKLTTVHVSYFN